MAENFSMIEILHVSSYAIFNVPENRGKEGVHLYNLHIPKTTAAANTSFSCSAWILKSGKNYLPKFLFAFKIPHAPDLVLIQSLLYALF